MVQRTKISSNSTRLCSVNFKKIGMVVKYHQPEAANLALDIARYLLERGYQVLLSEECKKIARTLVKRKMGKVRVLKKAGLVRSSDLILVIGGDGTYLSIAHLMRQRSIPILGINMGQLGFLTEIKKEESFEVLDYILKCKKYLIFNLTF